MMRRRNGGLLLFGFLYMLVIIGSRSVYASPPEHAASTSPTSETPETPVDTIWNSDEWQQALKQWRSAYRDLQASWKQLRTNSPSTSKDKPGMKANSPGKEPNLEMSPVKTPWAPISVGGLVWRASAMALNPLVRSIVHRWPNKQ